MSATATTDPTPAAPAPLASRKKGKKKGKGGTAKGAEIEQLHQQPQQQQQQQQDRIREQHEDDEDDTSAIDGVEENIVSVPSVQSDAPSSANARPSDTQTSRSPNGLLGDANRSLPTHLPARNHNVLLDTTDATDDAVQKLDAMTKDREALMTEVQELRRQLEEIKQSHADEIAALRTEIDDSNAARASAEEQYENLMGRVEKIRETLTDRLRRDKEELDDTKERVEELEAENEQLRKASAAAGDTEAKLRAELQDSARELTTLRSRGNLSAQNWLREKEDLTHEILTLKEEVKTTANAMAEWEVIAMEERSVKDGLADKVSELQNELTSTRSKLDATTRERDSLSSAVDSLQRSLQEIQEARRRELREMVETSQQESKQLRELVRQAESRAAEAEAAREGLAREVERTAPFEDAVKEKNLLIGKLRHEAIVLNEHLTKALRYLKKTKPEDNVDRQIVTNHLLHFLNLDRADPKRFQILQVMAGYLNFTDEQREQAGLARPGTAGSSLRLPISPFHRTPSTPSLNAEFLADLPSGPGSTSGQKESLADLWAGFLERSASETGGDGTTGASSRKDSMSSAATRPDTRGGGVR